MEVHPQIEDGWKEALAEEFRKPYFAALKEFLIREKSLYPVFPPGNLIFNAFNSTPFDKVRVVILGQDPYHGLGQAHGLCFSVPRGVPAPPSLKNILKELGDDLGIADPGHGNLESWASQGVLLLNATLTVRSGQAGSHQNRGWESFTDAAMALLSRRKSGLVFLLWGKYAQAKKTLIDPAAHLILEAPHPSPLSAYQGFLGCRHFSKTNHWLESRGMPPINWNLNSINA